MVRSDSRDFLDLDGSNYILLDPISCNIACFFLLV